MRASIFLLIFLAGMASGLTVATGIVVYKKANEPPPTPPAVFSPPAAIMFGVKGPNLYAECPLPDRKVHRYNVLAGPICTFWLEQQFRKRQQQRNEREQEREADDQANLY